MTQYVINIGSLPNDGTGDPLRTAFNETNLNFDQVFAAGPVLSNIRIANNTILTTNTNGNLVLAPNGVGRIQANATVVPSMANVRDLGSLDRRWNTVYSQYLNISGTVSLADLTVNGNLTVTGNTIQIGNITTETKTIQLANAASTANAANGSGVTVGANDNIATMLYSSTSNTWVMNIGANIVGNVTAPYFIGNGSLLTGLAATYGNANVVSYGQSGWAGNIIPSGNAVYSLGNATNQWNDLYVSNATIFMNNIPLSLAAGNVLTVNGEPVLVNDSNTTITTTGNITADYFIGDGSQLTGIAAGTGNLDITGTLIEIAAGAPETLINISPSGPTGGWAYLQLPTNDTANATDTRLHNDAGNIEFGTGDYSTGSTGYIWTLGNEGTTTIPGLISSSNTIEINNRASGNSADINLYAADDITIQARDRTLGSTSEGGDINIYAGDSAEDGDSSGGDVTIRAGDGGAGNVDFGGSGGFITIQSGRGGAAIGNSGASAEPGGDLTLRAGDAGDNNGNINLGDSGGDVFIQSGFSTGNTNNGGDIVLTTGTGGQNGASGNVQINIPGYGLTTGGAWRFNPNGSTIYPTLTVTRGDRTGTLTGQTLLFGDSTQEAIISTPDGTNDINDSQRLVINPGQGAPGTTGEGGDIYLYAGRGGDAGGSGGDIKIRGGLGPVNGYGGYITMEGGEAQADGIGGYIEIYGGVSGNSTGGYLDLRGGFGQAAGGTVDIRGGQGQTSAGGAVNITGGVSGVGLAEYGNVTINSGASTWRFDNTGNLVLPNDGVVYETFIPFGGLTGKTIALKPYGGIDADQQLLVYPTAGNVDANHLHLTSGNLYNTELYLGNDDLYVKLANTGNVVINTNDGVGNTAQWIFGTDGVLTLPGEGILRSIDDTVTLQSFNTSTGNANSVYLGSSGGLGFNDQEAGGNWLEIFRNGSDPEIRVPPGGGNILITGASGSGGASGRDITITAGPADQTNYYTTAGGTVNIVGGLGATNDGGGGGPGGNVNITAGISADPAGHAGNVKIACGPNSWVFDYSGNVTIPGNINAVLASPAPSLNGFNNVNAVNVNASGNITGGNLTVGSGTITGGNVNGAIFNGNVAFGNGTVGGSGNIDGGNISTTGRVSATGNIVTGGQIQSSAFTGGNISWSANSRVDFQGAIKVGGTGQILSPGGAASITLNNNGANIPILGVTNTSNSTSTTTGALIVSGGAGVAGNVYVGGNIIGNTAGFAIGYRDIPQVSFTGNATIATTDAGKHFYSTQSSNFTLTIANNASQGFQVGAAITVVNQGTGTISIAQGSGVTLYLAGNATSGNRSVATFGMATIMKVATDTWFINGTGVS